jgi:ubiquinone/menaquinone biosynthesis C-methylase UbiE
MDEQTGDARYTMGHSKGEEERLIHQSQLYDAITRRFLNEAGIGSGMRVLDIGCGPGDVSLTAAELVGSDGTVLGVDVNPAIVETARSRARDAGFSNVEFLAGGIVAFQEVDFSYYRKRPDTPVANDLIE